MIGCLTSNAHRFFSAGRFTETARLVVFCGALFLSACSKRERTEPDEAEWADIQPITNVAAAVPDQPRRIVQSEGVDYSPLIQRLEEMESVVRAPGEMMVTGESLELDYERRYVRMDQNVRVVDDLGELETETLKGRFSEDNKVELIEARKGVRITGGGRTATAESAVYDFQSGAIQIDGNPQLSEGVNRLSGDQIRFWIKGSRRMVCEPNAMLEITDTSDFKIEGISESGETAKIRSDRLVYDEERALAEFEGNVRMRHPQASLNSGKVSLHLKENSEIDWIEALSEVIIQSDERKAIAERAIYYADEGRFVLDGDPKVMVGRNILTGDRITFWQETERMVCEPNARVLLYPDEEMKAQFLKDLEN
jgi:lipopolysaccharide export system protein LptA